MWKRIVKRPWLRLAVLASVPLATSAVAATFNVDSTADQPDAKPGDGICATSTRTCTLRAAIMEANALGGSHKIVLQADTYTLTRAGQNEDRAVTGDLDVRANVTLLPSRTGATIQGGSGWDDRIFEIRSGARLAMKALAIKDGHALLDGGAILNRGTLSLASVSVTDSTATRGGGIANFGTLTMGSGSRVGGNTSTDLFDGGGGIFNASGATATLSFTTVTGNSVEIGPGGGIANQGTLVVKDASSVTNNVASSLGSPPVGCVGGCCGGDGSSRGGGGIMNDVLLDGTANPQHGTLTLVDSTVDGNGTDGGGGGIANFGEASISGSTISNNLAQCLGGGIGEFALETTPQVAKLTMTNSTVSGNHAREGGALYHRNGPASLDYVTVTRNLALFGGGLDSDPTLAIRHSIVAGNTLRSGGQGLDCDGYVTSGGYVLLEDTAFCNILGDTTGNVLGRDPLLGPLADNGGPSATHAPGAFSSAVDAIPFPCGVATDQRGVARPQAVGITIRGRCDIGAVERDSSSRLGFAIVDPDLAEVTATGSLTYGFTWIVPTSFAGWRAALDALEIRLRDEDGTIFWLRFEEPTDSVRLHDDRKGDFGPAYVLDRARRLETPFVTLDLAADALDGPPGTQVTLALGLTFKPRAAGRLYTVEVRATGDAGEEQGFDAKGRINVLPNDPRGCRLAALVPGDRGAALSRLPATPARCRGRMPNGR